MGPAMHSPPSLKYWKQAFLSSWREPGTQNSHRTQDVFLLLSLFQRQLVICDALGLFSTCRCESTAGGDLLSVAANSSYRAWANTFTTKECDDLRSQWNFFFAYWAREESRAEYWMWSRTTADKYSVYYQYVLCLHGPHWCWFFNTFWWVWVSVVPPDAHLQHGAVVVQIREAPEQTPPDADVIQRHAHPAARQRMPHVVGVAQQKDPCKTTPDISLSPERTALCRQRSVSLA